MLLLFPCVEWVVPYVFSEDDNKCLVLVFPLLPVKAIVVPLNLFLPNFAIFNNALFVSLTSNPLYFLANLRSETIIPPAPFEIADFTKSCPSNLLPLKAMNKSPGFIVLSSMLIPEIPIILFIKFKVGSIALVASIKSFFIQIVFNLLFQFF